MFNKIDGKMESFRMYGNIYKITEVLELEDTIIEIQHLVIKLLADQLQEKRGIK